MKTKLVNRYFCDFCKKANFCASAMTKHERACTNNPNRVCGVCRETQHEQVPLTLILAALKLDIAAAPEGGDPRLTLEAAELCPACAFAAIRQGNPGSDMYFGFNLRERLNKFWEDYNADQDFRSQLLGDD